VLKKLLNFIGACIGSGLSLIAIAFALQWATDNDYIGRDIAFLIIAISLVLMIGWPLPAFRKPTQFFVGFGLFVWGLIAAIRFVENDAFDAIAVVFLVLLVLSLPYSLGKTMMSDDADDRQ